MIPTKAFEDYICDHAERWFKWAQNKKLGIKHPEAFVLVSGCTLVTSWAVAAFVDHTMDAEISLESRASSDHGTKFVWRNVQGPVVHHNSLFDPVRTLAYVYSTCTYFSLLFLSLWKATSTHDFGSVRLHQGLPSKAPFFLD